MIARKSTRSMRTHRPVKGKVIKTLHVRSTAPKFSNKDRAEMRKIQSTIFLQFGAPLVIAGALGAGAIYYVATR